MQLIWYGRVHAKTKRTGFLERMMETGTVEDWLLEDWNKSVFLYSLLNNCKTRLPVPYCK
jgi:hypothetical protein